MITEAEVSQEQNQVIASDLKYKIKVMKKLNKS